MTRPSNARGAIRGALRQPRRKIGSDDRGLPSRRPRRLAEGDANTNDTRGPVSVGPRGVKVSAADNRLTVSLARCLGNGLCRRKDRCGTVGRSYRLRRREGLPNAISFTRRRNEPCSDAGNRCYAVSLARACVEDSRYER